MSRLAERLAEGFGFLRIDLYSVGGHIYFGEFTVYPGGIGLSFKPRELDLALGGKWDQSAEIR